ncbi:MAG: hypothetical protein HS111_39025 [Kofleriaceae bacterium]|nr:hypothetical protein [Kofleriaceae bacterium]MCL4228317.1 hypothetical protein [Myxococcales bacterium]
MDRSLRAALGAGLCVALGARTAPPAHAQPGLTPPPQGARDPGRDTRRLELSAQVAMFASYPGSFEDPGIALGVSRPLWLGVRHRFFQWAVDLGGHLGWGRDSEDLYLLVAPEVGFDLFLGGVFGFELRLGLGGMAQLGGANVAGVVVGGRGGYVFRLWDDDRRRVALGFTMRNGAYLADDPGNDLGANAAMFALGLSYEMPLD